MYSQKDLIPLDSDFPFAFFDQELNAGFDMGGFLHWHDCLEISWVIRGWGSYLMEDRVYPMAEGDIIVINNLEAHHLEVGTDGMHQYTIVFDPLLIWAGDRQALDRKYLVPFFDRDTDFSNRIDPDSSGFAGVRDLLAVIAGEARERPPVWQLSVKAHLLLLLTKLIREFSPTPPRFAQGSQYVAAPEFPHSRRQQMLRLEQTLQFLEKNHKRDIGLEEAAAVCHLSPAYFSAYFKKATGLGFVDWLNRFRVNQSLNYLTQTNHTIIYIAQEVGFNSPTTFNQSFKRFTGRTPSDYRK